LNYLTHKNFLEEICEWVEGCFGPKKNYFKDVENPSTAEAMSYQHELERLEAKIEENRNMQSGIETQYQDAFKQCVNIFQKSVHTRIEVKEGGGGGIKEGVREKLLTAIEHVWRQGAQRPSAEEFANELEKCLKQIEVEGGERKGGGGGGGGGGGVKHLEMLETFKFFLQHDSHSSLDLSGKCIFEQVQ